MAQKKMVLVRNSFCTYIYDQSFILKIEEDIVQNDIASQESRRFLKDG